MITCDKCKNKNQANYSLYVRIIDNPNEKNKLDFRKDLCVECANKLEELLNKWFKV